MGRPRNGQGRTSTNWLPTHTYHAANKYWRSEEDYLKWKEEYSERRSTRKKEIAEGSPKRNPGPKRAHLAGKGASSKKWRPTHQYKRQGLWWRSEEHFRIYADAQALIKRAVRNEVSIEHQLEIERQTSFAVQSRLKQEQELAKQFANLKAKHGLRKKAMRSELKNVYARTLDPEIKQFFHLESIAVMKADEKLNAIRELFLSGSRPQEIMYRTALIVGLVMKEKQ